MLPQSKAYVFGVADGFALVGDLGTVGVASTREPKTVRRGTDGRANSRHMRGVLERVYGGRVSRLVGAFCRVIDSWDFGLW